MFAGLVDDRAKSVTLSEVCNPFRTPMPLALRPSAVSSCSITCPSGTTPRFRYYVT
jgi:hypothetical protein